MQFYSTCTCNFLNTDYFCSDVDISRVEAALDFFFSF